MKKTVMINGAALCVWQQANDTTRPTLVFLHDSLGCIELWRGFPEQLAAAAQCTVMVYDRQGYGQSAPFEENEVRDQTYLETEAGVLDGLLGRCGIDDAILFGHSDGASIALIAAAKYPARIKAVVSEAAHIFVEELTLQGIRASVLAYQTTDLKERLARYHGAKADAVFWAWAKTWLTDAYRNWSIEHFLPAITCPILVIQGTQDEYGSQAQVDGIVRLVQGKVQSYIVPDTGHTPHKEAKEMVLQQAAAFIRQSMIRD